MNGARCLTGLRRHGAAVLAVALAAQTGCSSSSVTTGHGRSGSTALRSSIGLTTRSPSVADEHAADAAARATFQSIGAPAFYVGIWDPRRGFFERAYGHAQRGGAAATVDDSFRIASITKTFTATVILQLVGEGKIAVDADISKYLPALVATEPALRDISVAQLLAMRSGLPDYLNDAHGIAAQIKADPHRVWTPQQLVDAATHLDVAPPGTPGYSNTNFVLLGLIAEYVSGRSLAELIAQRLTGPLHLTHTSLPAPTDTALPPPAAHGYLNDACVEKAAEAGAPGIDPNTDTTDWNTSYFFGAGAMISTVSDLGRWAATDLGTDLLTTALARQRLDVHDIGGDGFPYGLGIKRFGAWYGHDGDAFGWDTLAVHDLNNGVTFVAAANVCTGLNDAFLQLLHTLYPDQPTS